MKAKITFTIIVLGLLLAACGSAAGSPTETAPPPKTSTPTSPPPPTETPLPTPTPDPVAHGRTALAQGDLDEAVRLYNQALDAGPADREALVGLATAFYYRAEYESACRVLEDQDISRDPQALEMLGRAKLALAYYQPTRYIDTPLLEEAADAFEQWSTIASDDPAPYAYLAWVTNSLGDPAAAARRLSQAEAISQDHPVIHLVRAIRAEQDERYAEELEQGLLAWELLKAEPFDGFEHIVCTRLISYAYEKQDQAQEALEWSLKELDIAPARYGANSNVARRYVILDRCDQARPYAEREIELYPANPWAYSTLFICAHNEGDQATAFVAYRQAVERGAEDKYYWSLDLEGSAAERDLGLELSGIDLYGQKSTVHYTMTNSTGSGAWLVEIEFEWPGGSETAYVDAENLELAAGPVGWTTELANAPLSPGDWLRVTARCLLHVAGDNWVELVTETTIPELE